MSKKICVENKSSLNYRKSTDTEINDKVEILKYTDGKIEISCKSDEDGFLVLNDLYYPGWRAFVDGKETPIYKTDYILRSIYLETGVHNVTFIYRPRSIIYGTLISVCSLLFYGIIVVCKFTRRKNEI